MQNYEVLSRVYDCLTDDVDYEARTRYISGFFSRYGIQSGARVLDLACGTGRFTEALLRAGYRVAGLDASAAMLTEAKRRCPEQSFYLTRMEQFALPEQYDACICMLDSINHLPDLESAADCFACVASVLRKGGIFIFDVNTIFKHREILAGHTFLFDEADFYLVWDNEPVDDTTVRVLIDLFFRNGGDLYQRCSEDFCERAYPEAELRAALSDFTILGVYDDLSCHAPLPDSQRLYFVCRKK